MSDNLQLLIVLLVILLAIVGLIRNIFVKSHRKDSGCGSCPMECKCRKMQSGNSSECPNDKSTK